VRFDRIARYAGPGSNCCWFAVLDEAMKVRDRGERTLRVAGLLCASFTPDVGGIPVRVVRRVVQGVMDEGRTFSLLRVSSKKQSQGQGIGLACVRLLAFQLQRPSRKKTLTGLQRSHWRLPATCSQRAAILESS